jgi:hypothetical protein
LPFVPADADEPIGVRREQEVRALLAGAREHGDVLDRA